MSYSEFKIEDLKKKFHLTIQEGGVLFEAIELVNPSSLLQETLDENIPLALGIDTEKARSELIVAPVLVEIRKQFQRQIGLFSGTEFNIDQARGLSGRCDFIISHSPELLSINAPVVTLVEAKNDNIKSGIPQCIAEMVAAQTFNEQHDNQIPSVYGGVTTGTNWKFMKLLAQTVSIESGEHFISNLESLIGILCQMVRTTRPRSAIANGTE